MPGMRQGRVQPGERRFGGWLRSVQAIEVAFDDQPTAFSNINTRDELDALE
jgi:molybdenum cofactor guanylyltransferase